MTIKFKSWLWWLTWPFAHKNFTLVGTTLYIPKGAKLTNAILDHEAIHAAQIREVGFFKFYFLYLFACPFFWNPWRYKWELEAYFVGSRISLKGAQKLLRSYRYGWLIGHADNSVDLKTVNRRRIK